MSPMLYYGSAVLVALLLGSVSAWWAVGRGMRGGIQCGAAPLSRIWQHDGESVLRLDADYRSVGVARIGGDLLHCRPRRPRRTAPTGQLPDRGRALGRSVVEHHGLRRRPPSHPESAEPVFV